MMRRHGRLGALPGFDRPEPRAGIVAQRLLQRVDGSGRAAVVEVLVATTSVRALIVDGRPHLIANALQTGIAAGMQSLQHALDDLVRRGVVDTTDAARLTRETDTRADPRYHATHAVAGA
jgi:twitching motility protein PilT